MKREILHPTSNQTYEICAIDGQYDFVSLLKVSDKLQSKGDIDGACNLRLNGVHVLEELLGDESEDIRLEWGDENSRCAMELLYRSGIDHFLISDFELSSALLELLLELDEEDHLECSTMLAYNYVALQEFELFDEVINDISDKYPAHSLLLLWCGYMRDGSLDMGELQHFRSKFRAYYAEFTAHDHPADESYLRDAASQRPSQEAQAREMWLGTAHLWDACPQFIDALRG